MKSQIAKQDLSLVDLRTDYLAQRSRENETEAKEKEPLNCLLCNKSIF